MKKLISLLCAAALCLLMPVTAFAVETPGSQEALPEITVSPRAVSLSCGIGMATNYSVNIHATAYANGSEYVTVSCQLQRKVNGSWINYSSGASSSGRGSATASKTIEVTKGYEYRTMAYSSSLNRIKYSDPISM